MSGFDSAPFKKTIPQSPQRKPLQEFNVMPPEMEEQVLNQQVQQTQAYSFSAQQSNVPPTQPFPQPPTEAELQLARQQKFENAGKIAEIPKKRIELLANIGRLTKDVKIGDYTFTLRTLKSKETREAALSTFGKVETNLEASYEARIQQLARSIFKIDGEDIEVILGTNDLTAKMNFLEDYLEDIVIEKLWTEFTNLKEEARVKYGLNTTKEAEEVAEDLKK